jgi:transcriptional regulator with XRE-family HTH domain
LLVFELTYSLNLNNLTLQFFLKLIINQYKSIVNSFLQKVTKMSKMKNRIKLLRKHFGLRQQDMALSLMVPKTAISKYELGKIKPSSDCLAKMVNVYNVNLNWLLTGIGGMFLEQEIMSATGTYGRPHLRLIKTNTDITVQNLTKEDFLNNDIKNLSLTTDSDEQMVKLAKKIQKPLLIEYFENGTKTDVKIFHPDGSIKPAQINSTAEVEKLKQKLENLADSEEKLEFVELAMNMFENEEAFDKLKLLIKGMELAKNK